MKTILVHPPFGLEELTGESASMKEVMNIIPPLGICYIAAYLEENGKDVEIIDCTPLEMSYGDLIAELDRGQPDVVGLSATTPSFESALKTATLVRERLPESVIVLGGVHVTALPEETLSCKLFDIGVIGEGELTMLELVNHLEKHGLKKLSKIKGIAFRRGKTVVLTGKREFIQDLDSLPMPARHLIPPLEKYHPTPASYKKLPHADLMTSRGCPSLCTFCDRSVFGCSFRGRSAENVVDEVEELVNKYGVKDIKFFDDTFTLDTRRLNRICELFRERGIDVPWSCLTKVNLVSKEMLLMMKKAGCWQILYGIESGDPHMMELLKKGTTVEQNEKAVKLAKEVGLNVRCDFLFGTPGDSIESMRKTLEFAKKLNPDLAHFNKFTPYPGTEIYQNLVKEGYEFDFSKSCSQLDHGLIMYCPEGVDQEEYRKFIDQAYRQFYLRPAYIGRQLKQIRSLEDVKRMWKGFKAIAGL